MSDPAASPAPPPVQRRDDLAPPSVQPPRTRDRRGALTPLTPLTTPPRLPAAAGAAAEGAGISAALVARLDRVIADSRRFQTPLALLSLTIDRVDVVEGDARAPELGADVALEFGHRLRARVRGTDHVLWLGGSEYAVILLNAADPTALLVRARLAAALAGSYRLQHALVGVSVSIGHAVYPMDGTLGSVIAATAVAARRPA